MIKLIDLSDQEMSEAFVNALLSEMNTLVPLDGGPECQDLWHALCGA